MCVCLCLSAYLARFNVTVNIKDKARRIWKEGRRKDGPTDIRYKLKQIYSNSHATYVLCLREKHVVKTHTNA